MTVIIGSILLLGFFFHKVMTYKRYQVRIILEDERNVFKVLERNSFNDFWHTKQSFDNIGDAEKYAFKLMKEKELKKNNLKKSFYFKPRTLKNTKVKFPEYFI
jgi:hypothetical protein